MDGHILLLFFGVLVLLFLSVWMSIPMGQHEEQRAQRRGGGLMVVRTRSEHIKNWQNQCRWSDAATALRAIRSAKGKRRLMYERDGVWYVVSGDDLEIQSDPTGDVEVQFLSHCSPIMLPVVADSPMSWPPADAMALPPPDPSIALEGWDRWPDSALAGSALANNATIERFRTLADAQRGSRPCSVNPSDTVTYIVGGSRFDPTYYGVQLRPDQAVVVGSSAGTSVYRRQCA